VDPAAATSCSTFRNALQDYLDGVAGDLGAHGEAHRLGCASCRADYRAAVILAKALSRCEAVIVPVGLTDQLVAAVLNDLPNRRREHGRRTTRWVMAATIAASLLLVAGLMRHFSRSDSRPRGAPSIPTSIDLATTKPTAISVDANLAEAGAALTSLTRRTADEALEPTRKLLTPAKQMPQMPPLDPFATTIQPAAQSLADIRQGAASGFAPVANSARRAFALFIRDLPAPSDRKPDF
jgi:hypothetical protein